MRCKSIRVKADLSEDETRRVVCVIVGNMRQVGCVDEVAWIEMAPGMAESVAKDLLEVAAQVRREKAAIKAAQ